MTASECLVHPWIKVRGGRPLLRCGDVPAGLACRRQSHWAGRRGEFHGGRAAAGTGRPGLMLWGVGVALPAAPDPEAGQQPQPLLHQHEELPQVQRAPEVEGERLLWGAQTGPWGWGGGEAGQAFQGQLSQARPQCELSGRAPPPPATPTLTAAAPGELAGAPGTAPWQSRGEHPGHPQRPRLDEREPPGLAPSGAARGLWLSRGWWWEYWCMQTELPQERESPRGFWEAVQAGWGL